MSCRRQTSCRTARRRRFSSSPSRLDAGQRPRAAGAARSVRSSSKGPDMSKSITKKIRHDVEDTFEDVAHTLRKSADTLTGDADQAVAVAAAALRAAADKVAEITPEPAKD